MSTWSNHGLPAFQATGYGFTVNAGLLRTPFDTARPSQTRLNQANVKTISATVLLTHHQLYVAEQFLTDHGYAWFTADILSSDGTHAYSAQQVRCTRETQVEAEGADLYRMTLTMETYAPSPAVYVDPHLQVVRIGLSGGSVVIYGTNSAMLWDVCDADYGLFPTRASSEFLFTLVRTSQTGYTFLDHDDPLLDGLAFVLSGKSFTLGTATYGSKTIRTARLADASAESCSLCHAHPMFKLVTDPTTVVRVTATTNAATAKAAVTRGYAPSVEGTMVSFATSGVFSPSAYGLAVGAVVNYLIVAGGGGGGSDSGGGGGGGGVRMGAHILTDEDLATGCPVVVGLGGGPAPWSGAGGEKGGDSSVFGVVAEGGGGGAGVGGEGGAGGCGGGGGGGITLGGSASLGYAGGPSNHAGTTQSGGGGGGMGSVGGEVPLGGGQVGGGGGDGVVSSITGSNVCYGGGGGGRGGGTYGYGGGGGSGGGGNGSGQSSGSANPGEDGYGGGGGGGSSSTTNSYRAREGGSGAVHLRFLT